MLEKIIEKFKGTEKKKIVIIGICAVLIIGGGLFYAAPSSGDEISVNETNSSESSDETENPSGQITVDIAGAVKSEIVVTLDAGSRVEDAIIAAGGVTDKADLSGINRAAVLTDGEKIYIPSKGESGETSVSPEVSSGVSDNLVNINEATSEELQMLSGIGPVTAEKIISYRNTYGRFKKTDDLKEVNGIGEKTFEQIKDFIKV